MDKEHKGIALVILGIVAIIAVVGLVLLFTGKNASTGEGVYGGAIKNVEFPYWYGKGVPLGGLSDSSSTYTPASTHDNAMSTHWNYDGNPKENPIGDIASVMTGCGRGSFKIPMNGGLPEYYIAKGYSVYELEGTKGAYACVVPHEAMIGGVAGQI